VRGNRPFRPELQPCLTAQLIDEIAAEPVIGFPVNADSSAGPLSRHEGLLLHFVTFLIGSWNLLMINLANAPSHLWFWPWVAAWAGALVLHLGTILLLSRRCPRGSVGRLLTRHGAAEGG